MATKLRDVSGEIYRELILREVIPARKSQIRFIKGRTLYLAHILVLDEEGLVKDGISD